MTAQHLSDAVYANNSSTGFYLFANPAILAAFEIVFLNGRRTPVIERGDAPFNQLGMGFRGYFDFGIREQDPLGAAFSKGTA